MLPVIAGSQKSFRKFYESEATQIDVKPQEKAVEILSRSKITNRSEALWSLERLFFAKKFYAKHPISEQHLEKEIELLLNEVSCRFRVNKNIKPKKKNKCHEYICCLLKSGQHPFLPSNLTQTVFFHSMQHRAGPPKFNGETRRKIVECIVPAYRKLAQIHTPHEEPFSDREEREINSFYAGFLESTMTAAEIDKEYDEIQNLIP